MSRYVLTDAAKDDVRSVVTFIRSRSPQAAVTVQARLRAAMRQLAEFPGMGHLREDVTDQHVRFWSVYSYLVVYRPDSNPLQVVRVLHGAQDLPRFFE